MCIVTPKRHHLLSIEMDCVISGVGTEKNSCLLVGYSTICSRFATFSGYLINRAQSVSVTTVTIPFHHYCTIRIMPYCLWGLLVLM